MRESFVLLALFVAAITQNGTTAAKTPEPNNPNNSRADEFALPSVGETLVVQGVCGEANADMKFSFLPAASTKATHFPFLIVTACDLDRVPPFLPPAETADLKDAALRLMLRVWCAEAKQAMTNTKFALVRPALWHYQRLARYQELKKNWHAHPAASKHQFTIRLEHDRDQYLLWFDGRYFAALDLMSDGLALRTLKIELPPQGRLTHAAKEPGVSRDGRFLRLNLAGMRRDASLNLAPVAPGVGLSRVADIPFLAAANAIDVGQSAWLGQEKDDMSSIYDREYCRYGWDNLNERIIFTVPKRYYNCVYALYALLPGESREPKLTVRLARYRPGAEGFGTTVADSQVGLDPESPKGGVNIQKVGEAALTTDGKRQSLPVFMAKIPLRGGEIVDQLRESNVSRNDWANDLELEFCRQIMTRVSAASGRFDQFPLGPKSSVALLGVTLETAPLEIFVGSDEIGNVFERETKRPPTLGVDCGNPGTEPVKFQMKTVFTDFSRGQRESVQELTAAPGANRFTISLRDVSDGWHRAEFDFVDADGNTFWRQPLTFAILPPDTRRAGPESPFGVWHFWGIHNTEADGEKALPLVRKLGFRNVCPRPLNSFKPNPQTNLTAETLKKYGVRLSMLPTWPYNYWNKKGFLDEPGNYRKLKDTLSEYLATWPVREYAMIFHEAPLPGLSPWFPPELLGEPAPVEREETEEQKKAYYDNALAYAKALREVAPDFKIMIGNSSTSFNVNWLRTGFPEKYWDAIGMETPNQLFPPESQPNTGNLQSIWLAEAMKRHYGYRKLKVETCFEYCCRAAAPGALNLRRQAEWYVRDMLHCLAYGMDSINVGLLSDVDNSYYGSRWGSVGLCFRAPLMNPKPSYVAIATLTRIFDRATYVQALATGTCGVYALEFNNPDGHYVYACWTVKGERSLDLAFAAPSEEVTLIDLMGAEKPMRPEDGRLAVEIGPAPVYLRTKVPIAKVIPGVPLPETVDLRDPVIVAPLALGDWQLNKTPIPAFENYTAQAALRPGRFSLAVGDDGGLRVTLAPDVKQTPLIANYVALEPTNGLISCQGEFDTIGVWVKGESNWARIYFEIVDAKGEVWNTCGWEESPGKASWDMSDWEGKMSVDFDGWRFIQARLPSLYPCGYYRPWNRDWRHVGDNRLSTCPTFPVKFKRFYVVLRQSQVYLNKMVPVARPWVTLKDVTVGTGTGN